MLVFRPAARPGNTMKISILTFGLMGLAMSCAVSCRSLQTKKSAPSPGYAYAEQNPVRCAKPMYGTGAFPMRSGNNNCFPGPVAPFGMIQWSPDTEAGTHKSGYFSEDKRISDFSLDHISGAGAPYGEDFAMMPILGPQPTSPPEIRTAFAQDFSHKNEIARPGYYAVTLGNGVTVELTTTSRSGFGRFTYPSHAAATFMINAASDINHADAAEIDINPARREVTGWSLGGYFGRARALHRGQRKVYFYEVFDRPFAAWSAWSDKTLTKNSTHGSGLAAGAFITFDTSKGRTVLAKVGISYVSLANAKKNVETESPMSAFTSADFDKAVRTASQVWNSYLNRIQISGGTNQQREIFYSMLYHALIGPCIVSDADDQYFGYDEKVHTTPHERVQYGVFSGWDIYRSQCQLLAMIAPKEASDMAQSLLVDYQQGGTFPRWGVVTQDSGDMIGDPAAAMIADFYAFGARNFEAKVALAGLVKAATDPSVYSRYAKTHERDALADYLKLGYVPGHQKGLLGNVSMTLEYCSADFALSQFAQALGDQHDSEMLLRHAQKWKNLFNPQTGYIQMRLRDGSWAPGFSNDVNHYDDSFAYDEGTAAQYVWMVPFNIKGLAEKMGGPAVAAKRLDFFFTKLNAGLSQYAFLGNEPGLNSPWIYDFLNQPWKTQAVVRRAMTELYSAGYGAYPGNDDVGEMSSWYVFAALGMYPELPGSDVLVLGSPLFPKSVLHLPNGDVTIIGHGASAEAPYVQSLTLNGKMSEKPWIRFTDISHGGTLIYNLSSTANPHWGSNFSDAPPSYP
jgi:predicted alpha-1,2-mannosidase